MGHILYNIFIFPLETLFTTVLNLTSNYLPMSLCVIMLSIVVQTLSSPLYYIAGKIEKIEKDLLKKIISELNVIKTLYKGEQQFKRIDALYKRYKYNPFLSFRASMSLLLIIPFFVAAYRTLNGNALFLDQTFFGFFALEYPDGILFGINFLPILMTVFNLIAISVSNKNKPLLDKSNYMLLFLALFFLVYLYNKSSSLLVYWTFNNFISMSKFIVKSRIT